MLRITKAEEQGLRLAMGLAASGRLVSLGELAAQERLPEPTVAKHLALLRRGRVVLAERGRNGGYRLATVPAEISVADILRALGAEPAPDHHCLGEGSAKEGCPRLDDCGLRSVWRHLQLQVTRLLEGTSLADLLRRERRVNEHLRDIWPRQEESGAATPPLAGAASKKLGEGVDRS